MERNSHPHEKRSESWTATISCMSSLNSMELPSITAHFDLLWGQNFTVFILKPVQYPYKIVFQTITSDVDTIRIKLKSFSQKKKDNKEHNFIPSYQISRWNRPSTFLCKDRNNVLQVLQTKPDKYCPVCHFTVATILNVSLPISNTTGKIPIAIWWGQTVQDYHGEVLRLRVSTDVIHLSASGWLFLFATSRRMSTT